MSETLPYVITISRQLGSGAAFIGRKLATRLGLLYLDREILQLAAEQLHVSEDIVSSQDEAVTPFWKSLIQSFATNSPEAMYLPPTLKLPNDHEVIAAEAKVITETALTRSAVVLGRGGVHVLRHYPRHFSIFLHASREFRLQRLDEYYHLPAKEACTLLDVCDHARARYHHNLSGMVWTDARQYHLCLDTSTLGISTAIEVILACVKTKFDLNCASE
jgi:cytidylate kinase